MSDRSFEILLENKPLDIEKCRNFISDPSCGGEVLFIGTVRNHTKGKTVVRLEFEAYELMAIREMEKIAKKLLEEFDVLKIAIHHRVGSLQIGEIPVIIGVSAHHRLAAFNACQKAIDTLKETVPIWKKEIFENGSVWVAAHP